MNEIGVVPLKFLLQDIETGLQGNFHNILTHRYMRRIWETRDGVLALAIQQGGRDDRKLALYRSIDRGSSWNYVAEIASDASLVCDGIMDSHDNLSFVCSTVNYMDLSLSGKIKRAAGQILNPSLFGNRDVQFLKFVFDTTNKTWRPVHSSTVIRSVPTHYASRATIAKDSAENLWCAFNLLDAKEKVCSIYVFHSQDGGGSWRDTGQRFGTLNSSQKKFSKVISLGERTGIVYHDMEDPVHAFKKFAWRGDADPVDGEWQGTTKLKMEESSRGPYYFGYESHWSVASDPSGNMHISFQDNGIRYAKFDFNLGSWTNCEQIANRWHYSVVGISRDCTVFLVYEDEKSLFCKTLFLGSQAWGDSMELNKSLWEHSHLRMCVPEKLHSCLPVVYQVSDADIRLIFTSLEI